MINYIIWPLYHDLVLTCHHIINMELSRAQSTENEVRSRHFVVVLTVE
jgi:hypothetical protein